MELKAVKFEQEDLNNLLKESETKIVLLQDVGTKNMSCSRCNASGNNSNEIEHKDCCPYIGGKGCRGGSR